jgi:hypothetical protein
MRRAGNDSFAWFVYLLSLVSLLVAVGLYISVWATTPESCIAQNANEALWWRLKIGALLGLLSFILMAWAASRSAEMRRSSYITLGCAGQVVVVLLFVPGWLWLVGGCLD